MGLARKYQICVEETPYYHIVSRCVRRAFLCGVDSVTGFSYEHRRKWIVQRMKYLAKLFAIDICAYAVMSNHFHIVIKVNSTADWSEQIKTGTGTPFNNFLRLKTGTGTPFNNFLQVYQKTATEFRAENNQNTVFKRSFI